MWIRLRLDVGWLDFAFALAYCLTSRRLQAYELARRSWSSHDDFLITLSVRSGFDLMLRALQLPEGSEVLMSALTVPDMVRIVQAHGLIPVPVDIDEDGNVNGESINKVLSPRSRMIVVAHLFGGWVPLDEVIEIAERHQLLLVEDCAQSFYRVGDPANSASDAAMFSFGPIKTATALGGAVVRVKSPELRQRMSELLATDPVQSHASFLKRLIRFAAVKFFSGKFMAAFVRYCLERLGGDFDALANSVVRGFSSSALMDQLRRQPSAPLLRLLRRRLSTYDYARIDQRIAMGRRMDMMIQHQRSAAHSYWVYPVFVQDPIVVRDRFRAAGYDATCQTRMCVVSSSDASHSAASAIALWKQVVFLPWYPELGEERVDEMAALILPHAEEN